MTQPTPHLSDHDPGGISDLLEERERLIAELQDAREANRKLTEHLAAIKDLRAKNRLIKIDYGYQPKCRNRQWQDAPFLRGLSRHMQQNESSYAALFERFARYIPQLTSIALREEDCVDNRQPFWVNDWMPGLDAISLYGMVAERNPRFYVEVGSGNSTKFVRRAIADQGLRTKIISIDPMPRSEIDAICDEVIRQPFENCDLGFIRDLTAEDILFVDSSHIAFMNTDVTVFFCEVLGLLPKGMLFTIHDIYLPYDYPDSWAARWYNEHYLLLMYLAGGGQGDRIILPNYYVMGKPEIYAALRPFQSTPPFETVELCGGLFWMEKAGSLPAFLGGL